MDQDALKQSLRAYLVEQVLEGRDVGLTDETPLLEWGVINSLELVRLATFIRETHGIEIPNRLMVAKHFRDISSIASLVASLVSASGSGRTP